MDINKEKGHIHPINLIINNSSTIFSEMGFVVAGSPEMDSDWYNFEALNFPKNHPAREMQDTFWVTEDTVMRTHTSNVQIRTMEKFAKAKQEGKVEFPLAIIAPGKVFRNEATDATHETQFHQIEGMLIGEGISLANMKWTIETYLSRLFEKKIKIRMRSSFFPFVEPGVEVDMECFKCEGKGNECSTCKGSGWIEIMGAGMIHPKVLKNCGIDADKYSGFAFGGGIDRIAMLLFKFDDIRSLYNGDLRVVNQF
jgi:phenylalanyl-tRNA synthetase alpha chain